MTLFVTTTVPASHIAAHARTDGEFLAELVNDIAGWPHRALPDTVVSDFVATVTTSGVGVLRQLAAALDAVVAAHEEGAPT
jgi:hypothetical protein